MPDSGLGGFPTWCLKVTSRTHINHESIPISKTPSQGRQPAAIMPTPTLSHACLALAGLAAAAPRFLAPEQDIVLWPGENAESPLTWIGANGPWSAGPNVHGISADVPENCYIDQAAYVTRHGSRYPDTGAYEEWKEMESRVGHPMVFQGRVFLTSGVVLRRWIHRSRGALLPSRLEARTHGPGEPDRHAEPDWAQGGNGHGLSATHKVNDVDLWYCHSVGLTIAQIPTAVQRWRGLHHLV